MKELSITEIQNRILDMAKAVKIILERNNIPYFITYGTLLGAVRHQGFIPWDDDFDFFLFEDSYDKAIQLLRQQLPEDYFVEDEMTEPLYFHDWSCVKEYGTEASFRNDAQNVYSHKGLSIDLFKAYLRKDTEEDEFHLTLHLDYLKRKYSKGLLTKTDFDARITNILKQKQLLVHDSSKKEVPVYLYPDIYGDKIYPEELFPLKDYKFEDTEFKGPQNADIFLKRCYGDYMTLPSEDKRVSHYQRVSLTEY